MFTKALRNLCYLSLCISYCTAKPSASTSVLFEDRIIAAIGNSILTEAAFKKACPSPYQASYYFQAHVLELLLDAMDLNTSDTQEKFNTEAARAAEASITNFSSLPITEQQEKKRKIKIALITNTYLTRYINPSPVEINKKLTVLLKSTHTSPPSQVTLRYVAIPYSKQVAAQRIKKALAALCKHMQTHNISFQQAIREYKQQYPDVETHFDARLTLTATHPISTTLQRTAPGKITDPITTEQGIYLIQRLPDEAQQLKGHLLHVPYKSVIAHAPEKAMLDTFAKQKQHDNNSGEAILNTLKATYPNHTFLSTEKCSRVDELLPEAQLYLATTPAQQFETYCLPITTTQGAHEDEILLEQYYITSYAPGSNMTPETQRAYYYQEAFELAKYDNYQAYTQKLIQKAIQDERLYVHPDYQHLIPKVI